MSETPWVEQRLDYVGGSNLIYLGKHKSKGAPESELGWYITKFTYDGSNNLTSTTGAVIGRWSERAALF